MSGKFENNAIFSANKNHNYIQILRSYTTNLWDKGDQGVFSRTPMYRVFKPQLQQRQLCFQSGLLDLASNEVWHSYFS